MEKGIITLRRENNKIVEKAKRKIEEGNKIEKGGVGKTLCACSARKKGWFAFFDYFNRFFSNRCVFDSFRFKRYLVSDFIASNY